LLTGCLPFDDESIANLFEKIKEGRFRMPRYLSEGASNLISRMIQPNSLSRITIGEIKNHVWYRDQIPLYISMLDNSQPVDAKQEVIPDILNKLFQVLKM
jgi:serine/threonine protein kinase